MKRGRNQRRRQGVNVNRALDSNGPDVRIRGTANQIYDKYQSLARDATSSGDRVKAESYLQHAEHYFRVIKSMTPANVPMPNSNNGDQPDLDDGDESDDIEDNEGARSAGSNGHDPSRNDQQGERQNNRPNNRQRDPRRRRPENGEQRTPSAPHEAPQPNEAAAAPSVTTTMLPREESPVDQADETSNGEAEKPARRTRKKRVPVTVASEETA